MDLLLRRVGRAVLAARYSLVLLALIGTDVMAGFRLASSPTGACWATLEQACATFDTPTAQWCGTLWNGGCNTCNKPSGTPLGWAQGQSCNEACPGGQERYGGLCVPVCQPGETRNPSGQCVAEEPDEPCDAEDQTAAQQWVSDQNAARSPVTSMGNLSSGLNQIQESTSVTYGCNSSCVFSSTTTIRLGAVTGSQYEIIDDQEWVYVGGSCESMPEGSTQTNSRNIGYNGTGTGCGSGFSFGTVNGQTGCHYHGQTNGSQSQSQTTTTTTTNTTTTGTGGGEGGTSTSTSTSTSSSSTTTTTAGGSGNNSCYGPACQQPNGDGGGGEGGEGGGYTGGRCEAGNVRPPDCLSDLDVIQCGIFLETWQQRCNDQLRSQELFGTADDLEGEDSVIGESEANEVGEEEVDFTGMVSEVLDDSLFVFTASCPAPVSFSIMGSNFQISYEWACTFAEMIRPFVIALGYLMGVLTIAGYFRGGNS